MKEPSRVVCLHNSVCRFLMFFNASQARSCIAFAHARRPHRAIARSSWNPSSDSYFGNAALSSVKPVKFLNLSLLRQTHECSLRSLIPVRHFVAVDESHFQMIYFQTVWLNFCFKFQPQILLNRFSYRSRYKFCYRFQIEISIWIRNLAILNLEFLHFISAFFCKICKFLNSD